MASLTALGLEDAHAGAILADHAGDDVVFEVHGGGIDVVQIDVGVFEVGVAAELPGDDQVADALVDELEAGADEGEFASLAVEIPQHGAILL